MERHGKYGTRVYRIWQAMKARCHNPNTKQFLAYGAKGIAVCPSWRSSFKTFLADMGELPSEHHTVDRIDNAKGYNLENCRWATRKEQSINSSKPRMIAFKDKTMNLSEWARFLGIHGSTLHERLQRWPIERALSVRKAHRYRKDVLASIPE